jgi:predicted Zn-dependent peptidase
MQAEFATGEIKEKAPRNKVSCFIEYYPEEIFVCNATLETDSSGASKVVDLITDIEREVIRGDVNAATFDHIKQSLKQEFVANQQNNQYWLDVITDKELLGKDFISAYIETLESISIDKFIAFVRDISSKGNHVSVVMEGTTEDVNTQNLFRDNEFIRDFFGL